MSIYKPLPPAGQWIRVLTLYPPAQIDDVPALVCSLQVVPLDEACYEAISYAWGDPKETRQILCDDSLIDITVSLYGALERLQPSGDKEPRKLWADAICINQSDLAERSSQVRIMGAVFERASGVQIWLGPDIHGHAQPAFNLCMEIDEYCSNGSSIDTENDLIDWPPPPGPGEPILDPTRWKHLESLPLCPWFERLWVIQEAGVARTADVSWGNAGIKFSHLVEAFIIINENSVFLPFDMEYGACFGYITDPWWHIWCTYDNEYSWRNERPYLRFMAMYHSAVSKRNILNVLLTSVAFRASDPHDHIYAHLGHPAARQADGAKFVDVDYRKSISELNLDVAEKLLDERYGLLVLSAVGYTGNDSSDGPSWVPQWHKASLVTLTAPLPEDRLWYDASLYESTKHELSIKTESMEGTHYLRTRGIVFDMVDAFSMVFEWRKGWHSQHPVEAGLSLVQSPNNSEAVDALSLVMVTGRTDYFLDSKAAEEDLNEHRARFVAYCSTEKEIGRETKDSLIKIYEPHLDTQSGNSGADEYGRCLGAFCDNRRLFRTSTNYLFGLGPAAMQQGDLCCVLFGSRVPFVIRRSGSEYKLIGECYIHGVMRGEVVKEMLKGERVVEDIVFS
ncbi:MAG: hypothetical protein Q9202_004959 [Teloschistes flavicans]